MRSAPVRLLAAGLALLALTAACGGTSGSASPAGSAASIVAHAGISHPVSWVAAVNIVGLGLAGVRSEDDPNRSPLPQDSVVGAVLSAAPGSGGRYELGIYIEIKGG